MAFQYPLKPQHLDSLQRLSELVRIIRDDASLNTARLPGLADLLSEHASHGIWTSSKEDLMRRMIRVFKDSTTEASYSQVLSGYSGAEQRLLNRFVIEGEPASKVGQDYHVGLSSGARQEFEGLKFQPDEFIHAKQLTPEHHSPGRRYEKQVADADEPAADGLHSWVDSESDFAIYDDSENKRKVPVYFNETPDDWCRTTEHIPQITCVPTTSYGVQQIVKRAKAFGMNVRASGYRHSWSAMFGNQAQILICTSDDQKAPVLPSARYLVVPEEGGRPTELNAITFQGRPKAGWSRLVRMGTAVTNEQLRRWCNGQKGSLASTMPLNVSMADITLGTSNATICHGAGRVHPSLSDLVHAIEYVDANGSIQELSKETDPEGMKAASGCFGLLGIITHITFELEPMAYAVLRPQKLHITEAIPLPPGRNHTFPFIIFFHVSTSKVVTYNSC